MGRQPPENVLQGMLKICCRQGLCGFAQLRPLACPAAHQQRPQPRPKPTHRPPVPCFASPSHPTARDRAPQAGAAAHPVWSPFGACPPAHSVSTAGRRSGGCGPDVCRVTLPRAPPRRALTHTTPALHLHYVTLGSPSTTRPVATHPPGYSHHAPTWMHGAGYSTPATPHGHLAWPSPLQQPSHPSAVAPLAGLCSAVKERCVGGRGWLGNGGRWAGGVGLDGEKGLAQGVLARAGCVRDSRPTPFTRRSSLTQFAGTAQRCLAHGRRTWYAPGTLPILSRTTVWPCRAIRTVV